MCDRESATGLEDNPKSAGTRSLENGTQLVQPL